MWLLCLVEVQGAHAHASAAGVQAVDRMAHFSVRAGSTQLVNTHLAVHCCALLCFCQDCCCSQGQYCCYACGSVKHSQWALQSVRLAILPPAAERSAACWLSHPLSLRSRHLWPTFHLSRLRQVPQLAKTRRIPCAALPVGLAKKHDQGSQLEAHACQIHLHCQSNNVSRFCCK